MYFCIKKYKGRVNASDVCRGMFVLMVVRAAWDRVVGSLNATGQTWIFHIYKFKLEQDCSDDAV